MRVLLDTNVLLRLADSAHARHAEAIKAVDSLVANGDELLVVPQNLYEFWAVCTKTTSANGLGKSTAYARQWTDHFSTVFKLLKDDEQLYEFWIALVEKENVSGTNAHDTRLVAAMLTHNITHILTFNAKDFRHYSQIELIEL